MSKVIPKMSLVLPGEYCNACSQFEPEVVAEDLYADNRCIGNYRSIICQNEKKCQQIYEYLTKALKKQDDLKTCENCEYNHPGSPYCFLCDNKRNLWSKIDE